MADIGIPHPAPDTTEPDVFTGTDPKAEVGVPHDFPDTTEPGVFTGTDPKADVGKPHPPGDVGTGTSP